MREHETRHPALSLLTALLCSGADLPAAKLEPLGFSTDRLQNLHELIQHEIDQKQLAGAVTILARHGEVIEYRTYGQRDMQTGAPLTKNVIFRACSMTKPVTGVAIMIRQMAAVGSHLQVHPGVCSFESLQRI